MDASKMIVLKNGEEVPHVSVLVTMLQLRALEKKNIIALFELHAFCLDHEHNFFLDSAEQLVKESLLTPLEGGGYTVHDIIRAIVLSAVEGEGLDFHITSPLPENNQGAEETAHATCECVGTCDLRVELPLSVAGANLRSGAFMIIENCATGPSPNDVLVEKREGYSLYREG